MMMSESRSTGLVRNVSLPALANATASAQPVGVPRVSSFSTMAKPPQQSLYPAYADTSDDEADGMVPEVFSHAPDSAHAAHVQTALVTDSESDDDDDDDHPPDLDREMDAKSNSNRRILASTTVSTQPSFMFSSTSKPRARSSLLVHIRTIIAAAICKLTVFVPNKPNGTHADTQLKFLFLAAVSLMLFPCAALLAYALRDAWLLRLITLLILAVPFVARLTADVYLATVLLISDIIAYTISAAGVTSPVILVWTSLVPVVAFTTLGNRLGLASSAATAAYILKAEFPSSGEQQDGCVSMIAAVWVLFLGCLGVVQTQIRAVTMASHGRERQGEMFARRDALVPDSTRWSRECE